MKNSIVAFLLIALTALATTASAQTYGTDVEDTLLVADTTVEPGAPVLVAGDGFAADSLVVITIESTPRTLDRVRADGDGGISTEVTVPSDMPAGQHTLKATGTAPDGAQLVLASSITVGGDVDGVDELANTGLDAAIATAVAVVLMALGVAALVVTRKHAA